jgi:hypothetical protein
MGAKRVPAGVADRKVVETANYAAQTAEDALEAAQSGGGGGDETVTDIYNQLDTLNTASTTYSNDIGDLQTSVSGLQSGVQDADDRLTAVDIFIGDRIDTTTISHQVSTPDYSGLPSFTEGSNINQACLNLEDGLIYRWDGTSWPAEGEGIPFSVAGTVVAGILARLDALENP